MVREGHCRGTVLGGPAAEAVYPAGPIQQGVFRVYVEMNELAQTVSDLK